MDHSDLNTIQPYAKSRSVLGGMTEMTSCGSTGSSFRCESDTERVKRLDLSAKDALSRIKLPVNLDAWSNTRHRFVAPENQKEGDTRHEFDAHRHV